MTAERSKMLKTLIVFFACGAPAAALADVDQADNIRIATGRIMDVMIQEDIPAVSVRRGADGEMVWAEGFGVADRARAAPPIRTPRTPSPPSPNRSRPSRS